jgi:DNA-binding PadR family transcriptional regulator
MEISNFTDKNFRLLAEMHDKYEKKLVTARDQNTYSPFAFYLNIIYLKDKGLVAENGTNEKNRKEWRLTKKGKIMIEKVMEIEEILKGV